MGQEKRQRNTARKLLTTDSVRKLQTDDIRGMRISDSSLSGFGITVYPSGKKTFWCRYGPRNCRRFKTIRADQPSESLAKVNCIDSGYHEARIWILMRVSRVFAKR